MLKYTRIKSSEKGFSLVEVLVALTIFSVGLLGLASMQVTGIKGNTRSQSLTAKNAVADGILEEFLALDGSHSLLDTGGAVVTYDPWKGVAVDGTSSSAQDGSGESALAGAGTCSAIVVVQSNPTISGTVHTGLTQIQVTVANNRLPSITKTMMKRRY